VTDDLSASKSLLYGIPIAIATWLLVVAVFSVGATTMDAEEAAGRGRLDQRPDGEAMPRQISGTRNMPVPAAASSAPINAAVQPEQSRNGLPVAVIQTENLGSVTGINGKRRLAHPADAATAAPILRAEVSPPRPLCTATRYGNWPDRTLWRRWVVAMQADGGRWVHACSYEQGTQL
jgi:hypothetical protein